MSGHRLPLPRAGHLLLPAVVLALVPATARADFTPSIAITVDPPTAGQSVALTSTITQPAGQTASKRVEVVFPGGFQLNTTVLNGAPCYAADEAAYACPGYAQIGSVHADTVSYGAFDGGVYNGGVDAGRYKLIVLLSNPGLGIKQTLEGFVTPPSGATGPDVVFDNLPNVPITLFRLAFPGGPAAVNIAPTGCGGFDFAVNWVSYNAEQASGTSHVDISGCAPPPPPPPPPLTLTKATIKAGTLTFTLSVPATVKLTLSRGGHAVKRRTVHAKAGATTVRGLAKGLKPGKYTIKLAASTTSGDTIKKTLKLTVRH